MNIKEAINEVRGSIKWKIRIKTSLCNTFQVQSNPLTKRHIIYTTDDLQGISYEYSFLHELIHAYLGEKYCLQLASPVFNKEYKDFFDEYGVILNVARDWYVDNYAIELIGKESFKENYMVWQSIKEFSKLNLSEDEFMYNKVLIGYGIALFEKNEIEKISIYLRTVNKIKRVLLKASKEPSKENYLDLLNKLLEIFTNKKVIAVKNDGIEILTLKD